MSHYIQSNINKDIRSYFLGFLFSFILTIIPFLLVMNKIFSSQINYILCLICAAIQIIVHFFYFLHLNFSYKNQWYLITLLFVMVISFIVVFGSIWIMCNLHHQIHYY